MSMLTAGEIAQMRATMQEALPDTAILTGGTLISDGAGGGTVDFLPFGTAACRVSPVGGGDTDLANRLADESTHIITLPFKQAVTEHDHITIASTVYEVTLVRERGEWELSRRVEAKESA